jgi:hypothetical protein
MQTKKISQSKDFKQLLKRKKYRYISLTTIGCLLFMSVGTGIGYGIFNKGSTSPTPSVDYKIHDVTVNEQSGNI